MNMDEKGFTLIEIAIVLVIVGLLVGMGASMIGPMTKRAKRMEAAETVKNAVQSVLGYAASASNRLPIGVPSVPTPPPPSFPTIIKALNDAWGKPLYYVYDTNLTANNICTRNTTNITVRQCNNAACTAPVNIPNVAFLVISGGANFNNQTRGNQAAAAALVISIYPPEVGPIADPFTGVGYGSVNDPNRNEVYDDIVEVVTLYDLKTKLGCTRYDTCSSAGITIRNEYSAALYFRLNGGACTQWLNTAPARDQIITPVNCYEVYPDLTCCNSSCITQTYLTFTQQREKTDLNNDCLTSISFNPGTGQFPIYDR